MNEILNIDKICKTYDSKIAVDHVSLTLHYGQIVGLLGPNGAGKTSLIRMITSITFPDKGQIFFKGEPLKLQHQKFIGYMPEERGLYKKMTVLEQLIYLLRLRGLSYQLAKEKSIQWLKNLQLEEWMNRQVNELSKGMQQKVQFILTVAHDPELLILDEPFSGLDPLNAQIIENHIKEFKKQGKTILFSTHRMEQAENFCEQIALIHQGKLILNDSISNLKNKFKKNQFKLKTRSQNYHDILQLFPIKIIENEDFLIFETQENFHLKEFLHKVLENDEIVHFEEILPSLNEIFIDTVSHSTQPILN